MRGLAIRELMAQTSATVALVEWVGPAGGGASGIPATPHPWTHNAREAGAGPGLRLDEDIPGDEAQRTKMNFELRISPTRRHYPGRYYGLDAIMVFKP
jgi:hypothetical protein